MQLKKIIVGRWYKTKMGLGQCVRAGGTFPVSVQMKIVAPLPRGVVSVVPRDVEEEVEAPRGA